MSDDPSDLFEARYAGLTLDNLTPGQLDTLDFGVVRLSTGGEVLFISNREREQSGFRDQTDGLTWLHSIAPCMDTPAFRFALRDGVRDGDFDLRMSHIGDHNDRYRELTLRLTPSGQPDTLWLMLKRS